MSSPDKDAPIAIRRLILRFAGNNPFGKPMWRACLAQNVRALRGGIFHNIEGGHKTMFAVAPDGKTYYKKITDRVKSGYLEVPRYPHKGWIMERWMPAHMWGTPESWQAERSEDGTPMMGPFPAQGNYFMINGPFPKIPDWGDMENAIAHFECQERLRPADLAAALKQAIKDEQDELERRRLQFEEDLEDYRKKEIVPMLKRVSLNANGVRNQLQKMISDRSHFAAL